MATLGNSANKVSILIETKADTGAFNSASTQVQNLANKLAAAKAKMEEAYNDPSNTKSQWLKVTGDVNNYQNKLNDAIAKEQQATSSTTSLARSVALGAAAYDIARTGLSGFTGLISSSIEKANSYQAAIIGLSSTTKSYGGDANAAMQAAKDLSADGLMSITDAATGLKNLLATGFSLPQAITLMQRFKDSAAFNRQETLGFGQAVRTATEGIKNGNSILVDNAGVTKNLSVILQEHGKSQQDVMNITQDASVRQALYNGLLQETNAQVGNANRLSDTYAGAQARSEAAVTTLQQRIGSAAQLISGGFVSAFGNLIATNQSAIVSFGGASIVAVGFGAALYAVVSAIKAFSLESLIAVATNPLLLLLTGLSIAAGVVAYNAIGKLQEQVTKSNKSLTDTGNTLGSTLPQQSAKATKAMQDLAEKLRDIDEQAVKANRDFREQLAQIVKDAKDKIADLTGKLKDENDEFARSQQEQKDTYQKSQRDQADEHQKKVDNIKRQIDNLSGVNKEANAAQLNNLQDQLVQENLKYTQDAADKQRKYDEDVAKDKASHDKKVNNLQKELDDNTALLKKHATDVKAVQNVMLLDEIDKLKRSHAEQVKAFDEQRDKAIRSAKEATGGVADAWNGLPNQLAGNKSALANLGNNLGGAMGDAFLKAIKQSFIDVGKGIVNWAGAATKFLGRGIFDSSTKNMSLSELWKQSVDNPAFGVRAKGGRVNAGMPYVVGENSDGSLNSTSELFVPDTSGYIMNARDARSSMGGGRGGVTINQYNTVTHPMDLSIPNRELGWRLANA